jgi:hypothetical protein
MKLPVLLALLPFVACSRPLGYARPPVDPPPKTAPSALRPASADTSWLVPIEAPASSAPFDPLAFPRAFGAPLVSEEVRGQAVTYVRSEVDARTSPRATLARKAPLDVAVDVQRFLLRYAESLGLAAATATFAEAPLEPSQARTLAVWRVEGAPSGDSPCGKVRLELSFVDTRADPDPVRVRRTCEMGIRETPSFYGRRLPRTGKMGAVLFACMGPTVGRGRGTFVDRYGDVYEGRYGDEAVRPRYLHTLPPDEVEAAILDAIAAHRALVAVPPPPDRPPPSAPIPEVVPGACVAYVPGAVELATLGLTYVEEWGAAARPVVRVREWLASQGLLR